MFPHASDVIAPSGRVVLGQGPSASRAPSILFPPRGRRVLARGRSRSCSIPISLSHDRHVASPTHPTMSRHGSISITPSARVVVPCIPCRSPHDPGLFPPRVDLVSPTRRRRSPSREMSITPRVDPVLPTGRWGLPTRRRRFPEGPTSFPPCLRDVGASAPTRSLSDQKFSKFGGPNPQQIPPFSGPYVRGHDGGAMGRSRVPVPSR